MEKYCGKSVYPGVAIGRIAECNARDTGVRRRHIEDIEAEILRAESAIASAVAELTQLYEKAVREIGEEDAAILTFQQMLLADNEFSSPLFKMIREESVNAEYAVAETGKQIAGMFGNMDDPYFQCRAADVQDAANRVLGVLAGAPRAIETLATPAILVADDLSPSETVHLDKSKVLAFVLRKGSLHSHTAILARIMHVPTIINAPVPRGVDGELAIVRGAEGECTIHPDAEACAEAEAQRRELLRRATALAAYKNRVTETRSGGHIRLYANIGGPDDLAAAQENGAEGIGLLRSEFLYLQSADCPTEDAQFQAYRQIAEGMRGKRVIIRTLDAGADKRIDYLHMPQEENPALGLRAIRFCLRHEPLLRTQLRAICRAGADGNVSVMIPMIASLWEVRRVKSILADVKRELGEQGVPFGDVELGIMIETPAAVMIADALAREVKFFSIGTNDLTQYTLAIDRQNPALDMFYDAHHDAILEMIRLVCAAGRAHGIPVGICGDLAADAELTERFIKMGVDELSVPPAMILPMRKRISELP